ncbi:MAG: hypothetical protein IJ834_04500 [Paludibacteraceae bacterium]|nr:hypothetical protein [Paludibacteraceae bacterium]
MRFLTRKTNGVGSPQPRWGHNYILMRWSVNMFHEAEDKSFILMPVSTVTDNWNDLTPDLILFTQSHDPLMILEITTHKELRKNIRKCMTLYARFPQSEYFIFDYEKEILYEYDAQTNEWLTSLDYELSSAYFDKPLLNFFIGQ